MYIYNRIFQLYTYNILKDTIQYSSYTVYIYISLYNYSYTQICLFTDGSNGPTDLQRAKELSKTPLATSSHHRSAGGPVRCGWNSVVDESGRYNGKYTVVVYIVVVYI